MNLAQSFMHATFSLAFIPQAVHIFSVQSGVANLVNVWLVLIVLAIALIQTYRKSGQDLQPAEALTRFELSITLTEGTKILIA